MKVCVILIVSCFFLQDKCSAQLFGSDTLRHDGKYLIWFDIAAGPDIYLTDGFGIKRIAEGNFELYNGILTARFERSGFPGPTPDPTASYEDISLMYGVCTKDKFSITVISAGISYLHYVKKSGNFLDTSPQNFDESCLPGISLQAVRWLTFGAGTAIGIGVSTNLNTKLPSMAVHANFGFGMFK